MHRQLFLLILIISIHQIQSEKPWSPWSTDLLEPQANGTIFNVRRFNLNQLIYSIDISQECRESITLQERQCYAKHLDRYDGFQLDQETGRPVAITEDYGSDFDRNVCCHIWYWYECTSAILKRACSWNLQDLERWTSFPEQDNPVTYYCTGYEYRTYRCWPLPLWVYIVLGIGSILLLSCGIIAVIWYWRSGKSGARRAPVGIGRQAAHYYGRSKRPSGPRSYV